MCPLQAQNIPQYFLIRVPALNAMSLFWLELGLPRYTTLVYHSLFETLPLSVKGFGMGFNEAHN